MTDLKIDFNNCDVHIDKMFDIHDNQNVNVYNNDQKGQKTNSQRKNDRKSRVEKVNAKPKTLIYFKHGNKSVLNKQNVRVKLIFQKWNEWGWISSETSSEDFFAFFMGEPKHCNIDWKKNTSILSFFLRDVLDYMNHYNVKIISQQTGQSATSLVREQFGLTPNFDETRLKDEDKFKIALTIYLLDIDNPLPIRKGGGDDEYDITDLAFQGVLSGQLRSTKGI